MSLPTIGERAEAVITAKSASDHVELSAAFPGAASARFGSVVATRVPALADRAQYNKARNFSLSDQRELADIVAFYDDVGIRTAIEVSEPDASDQLCGLLRDAGFSPIADGITLHVVPSGDSPGVAPGLEVREVDPPDRDRYVDVLIDAYELPARASDLRRMFAREHANPRLRRYLAWIDGVPAAAAALYVREGAGLLAGAATLPAFRRLGCQSALISHRIADAADDSDLVVATAVPGSASHQNLARHGFETTHHRTLWRRYDWTPRPSA